MWRARATRAACRFELLSTFKLAVVPPVSATASPSCLLRLARAITLAASAAMSAEELYKKAEKRRF